MVAAGRNFQTDDWSFRRSDGRRLPVSLVIAPIYDNQQQVGSVMSFQDITTEYAWGYVWTRPGLPKKTRSMLNLAMLAALNAVMMGPDAFGESWGSALLLFLNTGATVYCGLCWFGARRRADRLRAS